MLERSAATARLTREIQETETKIADALVSSTALLYTCALAARDNDAPAAQVHSALHRSQKTIASLVDARAEIFRTHGALRNIFRVVAAPEEPYPCPEPSATIEAEDAEDKRAA